MPTSTGKRQEKYMQICKFPFFNIFIKWIKTTEKMVGSVDGREGEETVKECPVVVTAGKNTRHRESTSMYSLTFCVRFLLPERHQRKPAVQAAAVMLRTPPVDGQSPASQPRARNFENAPRHPPASSARRPRPAGRLHYVVISRDGRKLVTRVRVMLP